MTNRLSSLSLAIAIALGAAVPAHAALVVESGNNPPLGSLVQFNDGRNTTNCGTVSDPGANVEIGCLQDNRAAKVRVESNEAIEADGGQASVEPDRGNLGYFKVSMTDGSAFTKLILNIDADEDGYVRFFGQVGTTVFQSADYWTLRDNGSNWFTITGEPFEAVWFQTYERQSSNARFQFGPPPPPSYVATDLVDDIKQIRITQAPTAQVPLPGTVALLGLGLAGMAGLRRRAAR